MLQVPIDDLKQASKSIIRVLMIREKYMALALQSFSRTTAGFLRKIGGHSASVNGTVEEPNDEYDRKRTIAGTLVSCNQRLGVIQLFISVILKTCHNHYISYCNSVISQYNHIISLFIKVS